MKVITFFSIKGGTGKTTFNLLFASYLKYHLGKRVMLIDLDFPAFNAYNIRQREVNGCQCGEDLYVLERINVENMKDAEGVALGINKIKDMDYIIIDFPGSFNTGDAVTVFARLGVLDLVAIPLEMDKMILSSSISLARTFRAMGQRTLLFFNRIYPTERREAYDELAQVFIDESFDVSVHRIKNTLKLRRDSGVANNMRSSVSFPEKQIQKSNPAIIGLFNEIACC